MSEMGMKDDQTLYEELKERQFHAWEAQCARCGACCGAIDGDPCEHLVETKNKKYICDIYEHRFGIRKTRSGREFLCVPIRNILHQSWPGDQCCGYKSKSI